MIKFVRNILGKAVYAKPRTLLNIFFWTVITLSIICWFLQLFNPENKIIFLSLYAVFSLLSFWPALFYDNAYGVFDRLHDKLTDKFYHE